MTPGHDLPPAAPERCVRRFAGWIRGCLDEALEEQAKTLLALVPAGIVPSSEAEDADQTGRPTTEDETDD